MFHDKEKLIERFDRGDELEFLFFWGHQPSRGGEVGPGCLSQWWEAPFKVDDQSYRTAEHYMMAEKARLFGDESTRQKILAAPDPRTAKALGRTVRDFDEARWREHRFKIVLQANLGKFAVNRNLLAFLQHTGDRVLVEASPTDRVWGIGLGQDDPRALNPHTWQGLNLLGFALMETRMILK